MLFRYSYPPSTPDLPQQRPAPIGSGRSRQRFRTLNTYRGPLPFSTYTVISCTMPFPKNPSDFDPFSPPTSPELLWAAAVFQAPPILSPPSPPDSLAPSAARLSVLSQPRPQFPSRPRENKRQQAKHRRCRCLCWPSLPPPPLPSSTSHSPTPFVRHFGEKTWVLASAPHVLHGTDSLLSAQRCPLPVATCVAQLRSRSCLWRPCATPVLAVRQPTSRPTR